MDLSFLKLAPDAPNAVGNAGGGGGGAGVAEPPAGGQGVPAAASAAGAPDAGAPAAPDAGDGGEGEQQWGSQELPAEHWARQQGCATVADLERRFREQSTEVRTWKTQAEMLIDKYASGLLDFSKQGQPQQVKPSAAPGTYMGFPSREAYAAALQADPEGAMDKILLHRMESNPEFAQKIQGMVAPALKPMQEQLGEAQQAQFRARAEAAWGSFEKDWPEFARGKPLHEEMHKAFSENPHLQELARRDPSTAWEMVASRIDRRIKAQQLKATEAKMNETRAKAGTARVGAGGSSRPAGGTMAEKIRAAAAQASAAGNPVSDEQIETRIRQAENIFGVEMVHGRKKQ